MEPFLFYSGNCNERHNKASSEGKLQWCLHCLWTNGYWSSSDHQIQPAIGWWSLSGMTLFLANIDICVWHHRKGNYPSSIKVSFCLAQRNINMLGVITGVLFPEPFQNEKQKGEIGDELCEVATCRELFSVILLVAKL